MSNFERSHYDRFLGRCNLGKGELESWRYHPKLMPTSAVKDFWRFTKWGFAAFGVAVVLEGAYNAVRKDKHHGHDEHGAHHAPKAPREKTAAPIHLEYTAKLGATPELKP